MSYLSHQLTDFCKRSIYLGAQELHEVSSPQLVAWIAEVVRIESPVHISEVTKRITDAAGVAYAGSRIRARIQEACVGAVEAGSVFCREDFLWNAGARNVPLRDRNKLPTASRKIELVAPEEIAAVINKVVAGAYGIEFDQISIYVARLLGFARMSVAMRQQIEALIYGMLKTKRLVEQAGHVIVGEGTLMQEA